MDTGRTETDKLRCNQEETDLGDLCRSRSPCSTALQLSVHHADRERGDGEKLATVRERDDCVFGRKGCRTGRVSQPEDRGGETRELGNRLEEKMDFVSIQALFLKCGWK